MTDLPKFPAINEEQVISEIESFDTKPEIKEWLKQNAQYLLSLLQVYIDEPDTFGLAQELRDNPILILRTVLLSSETLYTYQLAYNEALLELASANGIVFEDIEDIPALLQSISLEREGKKAKEDLNNGGKLAIALSGSGASGKGTLGKRTGMKRVVNFTTRPARPGEKHDVDYHYIDHINPNIKFDAQAGTGLDKDTGFNIVDIIDGEPVYEKDESGEPIDYFAKYGPYLVSVHRKGRAKHGTSIEEFETMYESGESAVFFEHGPEQVLEAGEKLPEAIPNARVLPVCILPPKSGILPLAMRIAVRTYGDLEHKDTSTESYKIKDSYLDSTIGLGQIEELKMSAKYIQGAKPLGVAYIVNDNLQEAVEAFKSLIIA